jgi:Ca2+-binding RTX toxin-like protein
MYNWLPVWFTKYYYGGNSSRGDHIEGSDYYADIMYGRGGNDTFYSSLGPDTFYGGSGVDTINYRYSDSAVRVNLSTGYGSGGDAAGDRYNSIESVRGSGFSDTITGNGLNNVLKGGDGQDQLYGMNGNDRLYGEEGSDSLYGGIGNDRLYGGNGNDNFEIEQGRDTYVGGSGQDSLTIRDSDNITINLQTGRGFGGDAEGDTYSSIEKIVVSGGENISIQGSQADEEYYLFDYGNGAEDVELNAGGGNDLVFMEAHTSDYFDKLEDSTIDGGEGIDTITVNGEGGVAVVIDLENDRYYAADNRNDWIEINNFENAEGGWSNDTLIDDNNSNNTLTGNFGNDTFVFDHDGDSNTEADIITDFSSGEDRIDLDDTEINSWADLLDISDGDGMFNQGGGVLIRTADNNSGQFDTVFLKDATVSELNENDFIF